MGDSRFFLRRGALAALLTALGLLWGIPASAREDVQAAEPGPEILVRLRAEGPHAVTACAQARHRLGLPLAAVTRDGSDSLDRLHAELGVREVRALFRRPGDRALAHERAAWAKRLRERGARRSARADAARATRHAGGDLLPAAPDLTQVYRLRLAPGVEPEAAAARYAADAHVVWAQANFALSLDFEADDPFLFSSGSWGQSFGDLWGLHRVRAPLAWQESLGEGVVVAVVDTGIDLHHPDLAGNLWVNPGEDLDGNGSADPSDRNGIDDDGNGFIDDLHGFDFANSVDANEDGDYDDPEDVSDADPTDDFGHGTHVAGTIAAVAGNAIGVAGVAPLAKVMALKGFLAEGPSPADVLARGMVYAVANGADVINNSWSCSVRCPSNPVIEDAVALAASAGVVVVTSAGNKSDDVVFFSPENRRDTIVVGASDENDRPAFFTNTGVLVDVVAPGAGAIAGSGAFPERAILSTRAEQSNLSIDGGGVFVLGGEYVRLAGTSMSSPHVAGVAALILARSPHFTPDDVRAVLRSTARDLLAPGHDTLTGAGLVDAALAVQSEAPRAGGVIREPQPGVALAPLGDVVEIRGEILGDAAEVALSVGAGRDPAYFDPIPLLPPEAGRADVLADWDVAAREDGSYLIRLEVLGVDGVRVVEWLPLALERNAPTRLSSPGPDAVEPRISGELVVWESQRPPAGSDPDLDLFARRWTRGDEWRVAGGPGHQHGARLSGVRLAWLDGRSHGAEIRSCRVHGSQPCRDVLAAAGPARRAGLTASGPHLVWQEVVGGAEFLRGCRMRGPRCLPLSLPQSEGRQTGPLLSGDRLSWTHWPNGPRELLTCTGFPDRCTPVRVRIPHGPETLAGSDSLLAWNVLFGDPPILACRVGDDGSCTPAQIATQTQVDLAIAVSQHRIVWSAPGPGGDADVFFCEHDALTGTCPVQRITSHAGTQRNADVSGARVVWEDDREGRIAVFGLELPALDPVADHATTAGRLVRLAVRGRDPSGGTLTLEAAFADGTPLASRGARFEDLGDGRGVLVWRPTGADVGDHAITFVGHSAGRLAVRRSAEIVVRAPKPRSSRGSP